MDAKTETYAKALAAVAAYKHLPYRIRRRTRDDAETRGKLGQLTSDVHQEITYYRHLLNLDSELVGDAYDALIRKVYDVGKEYRDKVWEESPIESDEDMLSIGTYRSGDRKQMWDCINAMRQELRRSPIRVPFALENAEPDSGNP